MVVMHPGPGQGNGHGPSQAVTLQVVVESTSESTPVKAGNGAQGHGCSCVQHLANVSNTANHAYMNQNATANASAGFALLFVHRKGPCLTHQKGATQAAVSDAQRLNCGFESGKLFNSRVCHWVLVAFQPLCWHCCAAGGILHGPQVRPGLQDQHEGYEYPHAC